MFFMKCESVDQSINQSVKQYLC